ncbi:adenylylsulfatase HINT3 isoform X2 [Alnus glutinosa]|uniref:adenylylsulfatase HINT3 isoform X2 n=1 Tax=Alnus glutinosa TaxID=3517 RepID=UPI002D774E64|nr:adenylylsulfatase HINT3 isoform X2 [Alnus glutinosa]
MEARRLAILCSHLCPVGSAQGGSPSRVSRVSHSVCASGSEEKDQRNDCVFCKIIRGESPALKLYEDDACLCILDTNPLSHGHSLIIPKSHFHSLEATPPSVVAAMCSKVPFISSAIMKATNCDSFNLVVNNGAAAGQVIFHSLRRHPLKLDQETVKLVDSVHKVLSLSSNTEDSKDQGSRI